MRRRWTARHDLAFPDEFAVPGADGDISDITYDTRTVERHGEEFRWGRMRYASVSELKRELLDRWHGQAYPVTDAPAHASLPGSTDEAALRDTVWRNAAAARHDPSPSPPLPAPLLRRADLLVDIFGGVIARGAAPESLCWWEPSPCFPLSRGGHRRPPNLLPLHAAAHRDRQDVLLAAVVRDVLPTADATAAEAEAEAREAAALGASPQGQQQGPRFFVVQSSGEGADGRSRGSRTELRPLRTGPSPAAVTGLWQVVRGAVAAFTSDGRTSASPVGAAGCDDPDIKAADEAAAAAGAADGDEAAAAALLDLLCSNWAGLREGALGSSQPYSQLQLCGAVSDVIQVPTAAAASASAAAGGAEAAGGPAPAPAAAAAAGAIVGLLRLYLDCTADSDGAARAGTGGDEHVGGDVTAGRAAEEGGERLLRRARAALAAALGWAPPARRRRRGGGAETVAGRSAADSNDGDPRVSTGGLGCDIDAVKADAAALNDEGAEAEETEAEGAAQVLGEAGLGSGAEAAPAGSYAAASEPRRRSVGVWVPTSRRLAPLAPRHPRPLRRPHDTVLWPPNPQPVAWWVLLSGDAVAAAAEAAADASQPVAVDAAAASEQAARAAPGGGSDGDDAERSEADVGAAGCAAELDGDCDRAGGSSSAGAGSRPDLPLRGQQSTASAGEEGVAAGRICTGKGRGGGSAAAAAQAGGSAAGGSAGAGGTTAAAATAVAGAAQAEKAMSLEQADRARRAARRRAVAQQAAFAAAGRLNLAIAAAAAAATISPPSPQPPAPLQVEATPDRRSRSGGGAATAEVASSPPPAQLSLPGLRHLPSEAAAALERAFLDAAAAAGTGGGGGKRVSHLRSVPVRGAAAAPQPPFLTLQAGGTAPQQLPGVRQLPLEAAAPPAPPPPSSSGISRCLGLLRAAVGPVPERQSG